MSDKMSQDNSGSYYRPLFIITVIFISSLLLPIHILASKEIKLDSSLNMLKLIRNGHEVKRETRRHYSERVKRSGSMDTGLNVAEENTILAVHDDVRIVLGSSNMMMMMYADSLADVAATWVAQCDTSAALQTDLAPEFPNMQFNQYSTAGSFDINIALGFWEDQHFNYNYAQHTCAFGSPCNEYIQMVSADTSHIGCALNTNNCPTMSLFACVYAPGHSDLTQKPYKNGTSCSACSSGIFFCHSGLCRDSCTPSDHCECSLDCGACGTAIVSECRCSCKGDYTGIKCDVGTICEDPTTTPAAAPTTAEPTTTTKQPTTAKPPEVQPVSTTAVQQPDLEVTTAVAEPITDVVTGIIPVKTTTIGDLDCSDFECENGGTPIPNKKNVKKCKCTCPPEYKGRRCKKLKKEAEQGVVATVNVPISIFSILWVILQMFIARSCNFFCRLNVGTCCPGASQPAFVPSTVDCLSSTDVILGEGYPDDEDGPLKILFFVNIPVSNPLCTFASIIGRKKRQTAEDTGTIILPQDILTSIVEEVTNELNDALVDCCNVTLESVEAGTSEAIDLTETTTVAITDEGEFTALYPIIGGAAAVVISIAVIIIILVAKATNCCKRVDDDYEVDEQIRKASRKSRLVMPPSYDYGYGRSVEPRIIYGTQESLYDYSVYS